MAAAIELVPVNEPGEEALSPAARGGDDLAGENAASDRKVYDAAIVLARDFRLLEVDARGRRCGVREPVERDVVEHLLTREHRFRIAIVVGPGVKFLVDPGGLSRRGIGEGVTDRLRAGRQRKEVAETVGLKESKRIDGARLGGRQPLRMNLVWKYKWHIEMDGREARRPLLSQRCRDEGAPIAALRHIVSVAKAP